MIARIRRRRSEERHWKLMTATIALFVIAGSLLVAREQLTAGVAVILGVATLAVQWFCIDPPEADSDDPSDEGGKRAT